MKQRAAKLKADSAASGMWIEKGFFVKINYFRIKLKLEQRPENS